VGRARCMLVSDKWNQRHCQSQEFLRQKKLKEQ
jgi:hypothetical protein